jgi:hypothetical protein
VRLRGGPRDGRVRIGAIGGQRRDTAWRVILQASPVTLLSERAMNRVLLSKGLEINDLCLFVIIGRIRCHTPTPKNSFMEAPRLVVFQP